jgi:hypothetical protein
MAGVAPVGYRADLNAQQQAGALISAANRALSHTPDPSAKCWTQAGYNSTSTSNLYLGVSGASAMDGYVHDPCDNNKEVGHRWWLLHPGLRSISSGDIPRTSTNNWNANSLHIFDVDWRNTSTRDGFIAWPPPGYVPAYVVYPRWSFTSVAQEDLSNAVVTLTGPNGLVPVNYDYRSNGRIVFVPVGFERAPLKFLSDWTYNVTISGITGGSRTSYTYSVTIVPVNSRPTITEVESLTDTCTKRGLTAATVYLSDRDGDTPVTISLVDGDGARDNARFGVLDRNSYAYLTPVKDLDGTIQEFSVRLRATDARGATSEGSFTFNMRPSKQDCTPKSTSREVSGTILRGTSRPLRNFTAIPAGTVTTSTTGNCSMSTNRARVIASRTKGTCVVTITSQTGKATTVVKLNLKVR